jgi:hypothetical protein
VGCPTTNAECPEASPLAVTAKSFSVTYDLWALLSKTISITSLQADKLRVNLYRAEPSSEPATPSTPETPSASGSAKPSFTITIANAAISDSSFTYADLSSNSRYDFKDISIAVPRGNSNSDTEIKLTTKVTTQSEVISLRDELLSGTVTLRDAAMFVPRLIAIKATAGSAKPAPLEVDGALNFLAHPYGLDSITLTKVVVRESLPAIFAIPITPVGEFEYSIKGNYSLGSNKPSNLSLVIHRHRFIGNDEHDLKESTISSTATIGSSGITLSNGSVDLKNSTAAVLKGTFSATIPFSPETKQTKFQMEASLIDFDQVDALASALTPKATTPQQQSQASPTAAANTSVPKNLASSSTVPSLPLVDASIVVKKAVYQKLGISNIAADIFIPSPQNLEKGSITASFDNGGTFSFSSSGRIDQTVRIKAQAQKVNVLPFAALAQSDGELLEGNLDSLDVDLSLAPINVRTTITGTARTKLSRLIVPSTLQSQVPFNILFLPFDALITVFGGTLNAILPSSISSISDGIRQVLDDAGRLGIDKGTVNLDFHRGKITCQQVEIDTKNLPDFTIKGSVSADDKLDFTMFIGLLKLNLPLPVAGTLSTPLPDVMYLGPEIVRGLGLSIGNIAGSVGALVGGTNKDASTPSEESSTLRSNDSIRKK